MLVVVNLRDLVGGPLAISGISGISGASGAYGACNCVMGLGS